MAQVIDLAAYRQKEDAFKKLREEILPLYDIVEDAVDAEIARVAPTKEIFDMLRSSPQLNLSVVTSLCFSLCKYLHKLTQMPNEFKITKDTAEIFIADMIATMMADLSEKEKMRR